jgi:iron complex outermembrane recepter protein
MRTAFWGSAGIGVLLMGCQTAPAFAQQSAAASTPAAAQAPDIPTTPTPGSSAGAQPPADAADAPLGEIIVTAQRRPQTLQDVPVSVSVVSGAALQQSDLKTLDAVSEQLPDVKIASAGLTDEINIRGVGSGQNPGFEQSVATFVDDIYRPRSHLSEAALFDVDQVEVLKGPQTTFFGANAIAGALNITTRKPGNELEYDASTLYGVGDGEFDLEGGVTVPLTDTLSVRAAGEFSGTNGYIHDNFGGAGPHNRTELARIAVRWTPTSDFQSDLRLDYDHAHTQNALSYVTEGCPPSAPFTIEGPNTCGRYLALGGSPQTGLSYNSEAPYGYSALDYYEGAWTNALQLGEGSLTAISGYENEWYRSLSDLIPFPIAGSVAGGEGLPVTVGENYEQFSQELRYQSKTGGLFEYVFGAYVSGARLSNFNVIAFNFLPFGGFNPVGDTDADTSVAGRPADVEHDRTYSGFAATTINPAEGFRINLGLRYTSVTKSATRDVGFGTSDNANQNTYVPLSAIDQVVFASILGADLGPYPNPRRTDSKLMPSAGFQYDVAHGVMSYFTFSQGFKAGGFGATSLADEFKPETVNAYEVGLKGEFLDRHLTTNVALFRSNYSNLQESTVDFTTAGTIIDVVKNAASSRSQGVELGTEYRWSRYASVSSDLAYLDARYLSFPDATCTALGNYLSANCVQNMSGKERAYAPHVSGNVRANFNYPVRSYDIRFSPTVYFTSSFFESATADPTLEQGGYAKLDLRLSLTPESSRWEIALIGKNLTDKETANYRTPVTLASGTTAALMDPPRVVALQFSVKNAP